MKLLPCTIFALSCLGVLASASAFSADSVLPQQLGMYVGGGAGPDGHGGRRGPGPMHALELSEAQEQKAFAIRHAQEPVRFEQSAALRKAQDGLRTMRESGQYDEAKASALAQAIGKATAALALSHARADAQFQALLTPDQRAQLQQHRAHPMPQR